MLKESAGPLHLVDSNLVDYSVFISSVSVVEQGGFLSSHGHIPVSSVRGECLTAGIILQ